MFPFPKKNAGAGTSHGGMPHGGFEYIVAGLGNPGAEYARSRHNTGFMALDYIAGECGAEIKRIKFKSLCGEAEISGKRVLLLKPQTFMNLSGEAVVEAASFYKLPMEHVVVLFDDISLAPGKLRVRPKGSDGGHNGIKNIIYLSGTDLFPRVKIGVGAKPRPDYDLAAWVLGKFPEDDLKAVSGAVERAWGAVKLIVAGDVAKAMNDYNG